MEEVGPSQNTSVSNAQPINRTIELCSGGRGSLWVWVSREKSRQEKGTERKWDPFDLEEERRRDYKNERAVNTIPGKGVFRACLGELLDQAD